MLANKKILLAVTGSIAAFKTAIFVRLLIKSGAEVRVIMTTDAKAFITPLTLSTLSKNPVHSDFYNESTGEWINHVALGLWADHMIIAPATANTIAKMANGICDNLVLATYLSAKCNVSVAPAMDLDMYQHPATQANIDKIKSFGNIVIDPTDGELASGLSGIGRMAEPEQLVEEILKSMNPKKGFDNKKVLITSGPTFEPIDAVRFIGNHSSGKMGRELAIAMANQGAKVYFVTGPSYHLPDHPSIVVTKINTATEMDNAVAQIHPNCDIAIFAAAVADFRPESAYTKKRKKEEGEFSISLIENPDVALNAGKNKTALQFHVGFALETHNEEQFALKKLQKKNFDLIVLNSLNDLGAGFSHESNKITVFDLDNNRYPFELKSKSAVAHDIVNLILQKIN